MPSRSNNKWLVDHVRRFGEENSGQGSPSADQQQGKAVICTSRDATRPLNSKAMNQTLIVIATSRKGLGEWIFAQEYPG